MIRPTCPTDEDLTLYVDSGIGRRNMSARRQAEIALHLRLCQRCEEAVAETRVLIRAREGKR